MPMSVFCWAISPEFNPVARITLGLIAWDAIKPRCFDSNLSCSAPHKLHSGLYKGAA